MSEIDHYALQRRQDADEDRIAQLEEELDWYKDANREWQIKWGQLEERYARLLAVARAAKACDDAGLIRSVPWTMGTWDGPYPRGELLTALAAMEDLL